MTRMLQIGFYIRYGKQVYDYSAIAFQILSHRFWGLSYSIHVIIHFRSDRYILDWNQIIFKMGKKGFHDLNMLNGVHPTHFFHLAIYLCIFSAQFPYNIITQQILRSHVIPGLSNQSYWSSTDHLTRITKIQPITICVFQPAQGGTT